MFFEKKDKNQIMLDYYETSIQSLPFEKTPTQGGYIKIPFQHARGMVDPNLILSQTNEKYKTENLYVLKNSHFINHISYDGELVLEHKSLTNQDKTVYLVFLLKTDPSVKKTDIDVLIQADKNPLPFAFHFNKWLDASQRILSNDHNVFVIEQPISVQSSFSSFPRTAENFLFRGPFSSTFRKPGSDSLLEGLTEAEIQQGINNIKDNYMPELTTALRMTVGNAGLPIDASGGEFSSTNLHDGSSAYMECSPTGTSVDTIEMYNIPVNGEFANDLSKISMYRMVITMFFLLILIFIVTMTVPVMYKGIVVEFLVKRFIKNEEEQPKYLLVTDYLVVLMLFTASIFVTSMGMAKQSDADNSESQSDNITLMGFMMFMFTIFSIFIIQIFKTTNTLEYTLSTQKVAFDITVLVQILKSTLGLLWNNKIFLVVVFGLGLFIISIYATLVSSAGPVQMITDYWQIILVASIATTLLWNAGKTTAYNTIEGL